MAATVRTLAWQWDSPRGILWGRVLLSDGRRLAVGIPLSQVVATFDAEVRRAGIVEPPTVSGCATVSGLFGKVKRLTRKAKKATRKAVRRTTGKLGAKVTRSAVKWGKRYTGYSYAKKYRKPVSRYALKAARSKQLGAALGVTAAVMPAVGGPALGAWIAANRAAAAYDQGQRAAKQIQRGVRHPQHIAAVRQAQAIHQSAMAAARSRHPMSRLYAGALHSVH